MPHLAAKGTLVLVQSADFHGFTPLAWGRLVASSQQSSAAHPKSFCNVRSGSLVQRTGQSVLVSLGFSPNDFLLDLLIKESIGEEADQLRVISCAGVGPSVESPKPRMECQHGFSRHLTATIDLNPDNVRGCFWHEPGFERFHHALQRKEILDVEIFHREGGFAPHGMNQRQLSLVAVPLVELDTMVETPAERLPRLLRGIAESIWLQQTGFVANGSDHLVGYELDSSLR